MALWPLANNPQGSHRSAGQRPMSSHGLKPSSEREPSTQQRVCGRRQAFAHVPHLYTYAHCGEPTPRAQTSKRARMCWLGLRLDSLKPDLLSQPSHGLAIIIMDHRPLPIPALDWPFYLVWRPRPVRQPCFSVWGHCFTELLLISFCGSARYLWGRWESRQGQRGLSRRRNPLLLSVLPRSLQDASLAPHLGECPKPSVLEGLAAKFLLPPMACRVSQQEHLLPFYSSGPFSLLPPLKISSIHHSLCPGSRYLAAFRHPKRGSAIPAPCPPSPSCTSAQAARTQGFFVPWVWNLLCCTTNWAISSSPLNQMKDSSGSSTIAFF